MTNQTLPYVPNVILTKLKNKPFKHKKESLDSHSGEDDDDNL
jgi:hypothetical protein